MNHYAHTIPQDILSNLALSGEPAIPNIAHFVNPLHPALDINQLWGVQLKKWNYQIEYLEQWRLQEEEIGKEIDAFIMPFAPTAAVRHNRFKYHGYLSAINILDWTSVVVPVTLADKAVDKKSEDHRPLSELDRKVQAECKLTWFIKRLVVE